MDRTKVIKLSIVDHWPKNRQNSFIISVQCILKKWGEKIIITTSPVAPFKLRPYNWNINRSSEINESNE